MISLDSAGLPAPALGAAALPAGAAVGEFVLDALLAQGGFGQVYRAHHATSGRVVAVKVLHGELCSAPAAVARFLREAEVMVRVQHPHVVELVAWGTVDDGRPYLAMEFLTGTDLGRALATRGRLPVADALAIVAPVASALAAAHAQAIVHRDVKAANVFLATDGAGGARPILIDFGIAKLAAPDAAELTTSRQLVGTPVTMAPEQIRGGAVDARTDVYGLGVMTFHLLTGRLPFEDESPTIVQYLHAHARRPRASAFASLPAAIDEVIAKAMAIEPDQRYPGAPEFAAALAAAAASDPAAAAALAPRPAVGVLVEVRADDDAMADPDDALLADLEGLLPLAEARLTAAGYPVALHGGNLLLAARAIDGDDALARTGAIEVGRAVAAALEARPDRDPRVGFVCVVHAAVALCAGDQVRAGDLTDVAYWSPDPEVRGLVATRAALDGLPVVGAAVSDSRVWQVR
ncbi:MAG: serine/threonine protein kinase [Myxococcales bacterium]|nr:serine/threonine protein kinase [Myxococcales bacterium]